MADFNQINESLNNNTSAQNIAKVTITSLGGVNNYEITPGTTVRELKSRYGLGDMKIVNAEGVALADADQITGDVQLFVSTPKRNG
jgi:hypothetical protein